MTSNQMLSKVVNFCNIAEKYIISTDPRIRIKLHVVLVIYILNIRISYIFLKDPTGSFLHLHRL